MRGALILRALAVPYLTEHSVLSIRPFDLHVLGTPPAFVLSQDQTLQKKLCHFNEEDDSLMISFETLASLSHWLSLLFSFQRPSFSLAV